MVRKIIRGKENRRPRNTIPKSVGMYYTTRIRAISTMSADSNGNLSHDYSLNRFYNSPMNSTLAQSFNEARINYYKVTFIPNVNLVNGNVICKSLFIAPYHGDYNPTVNNLSVSNLIGCKIYSPNDPLPKSCLWIKSKADPEEEGYRPLTAAANWAAIGGIIIWLDGFFSVGSELGELVEEWGISYREPRQQ